MKKIFAVIVMLAGFAHAQTITPVVQEFGRKASGTFTVTNNTVTPLAVMVEPLSFDIVNGKQVFKPLAAVVSLSETSARIGPNDAHDFDFKVRCLQTPCAVQFSVSMILGRTVEGLQIRGILPEIVYICDREKDCRRRTLEAGGVPVAQ